MIELKGVSKKYNEDTVIRLRNYAFEDGKSYCILGPSGSGKSTLLNIIAGITKPTRGEVIIDEKDISKLRGASLDKFRYNNLGYISQDFKLFEEFTVVDNLKIVDTGGKLLNQPEEVLKWVRLSHKRKVKVKTLSGGEKQRVAIARALLNSYTAILCDEPTGSLNQAKAVEIMELLKKVHENAKNTLLVVTHDDRMVKYFDKVIKFEDLLIDINVLGGVEGDV